MKTTANVIALLAIAAWVGAELLPAADLKSSKPDKLQPSLLGEWNWESIEPPSNGGTRIMFSKAMPMTLTKTNYSQWTEGGTDRGTYTVRTNITPTEIDITWQEAPRLGHVKRGIYRFDGDELHMAFSGDDLPRPKDFTKGFNRYKRD